MWQALRCSPARHYAAYRPGWARPRSGSWPEIGWRAREQVVRVWRRRSYVRGEGMDQPDLVASVSIFSHTTATTSSVAAAS